MRGRCAVVTSNGYGVGGLCSGARRMRTASQALVARSGASIGRRTASVRAQQEEDA